MNGKGHTMNELPTAINEGDWDGLTYAPTTKGSGNDDNPSNFKIKWQGRSRRIFMNGRVPYVRYNTKQGITLHSLMVEIKDPVVVNMVAIDTNLGN